MGQNMQPDDSLSPMRHHDIYALCGSTFLHPYRSLAVTAKEKRYADSFNNLG
jgi:hypothetical protein